jgi:hypothetical protein
MVPVEGSAGTVPFGFVVTVLPVDVVVVVGVEGGGLVFFGCVGVAGRGRDVDFGALCEGVGAGTFSAGTSSSFGCAVESTPTRPRSRASSVSFTSAVSSLRPHAANAKAASDMSANRRVEERII